MAWTEEQWLVYENRFLRVMRRHVGKSKAISAVRLYEAVFGEEPQDPISGTRALRKIIDRLAWQGEIICSSTDTNRGGYFTPSSDSEKADYFRSHEVRALKILKRLSIQKQMDLPGYISQLSLDLKGA